MVEKDFTERMVKDYAPWKMTAQVRIGNDALQTDSGRYERRWSLDGKLSGHCYQKDPGGLTIIAQRALVIFSATSSTTKRSTARQRQMTFSPLQLLRPFQRISFFLTVTSKRLCPPFAPR